jgi:prepilin-type N-terminal cleavage/methylation domain-containing protein
MKGFFKATRKGDRGFTLVELLIVFALLAVLAAIVIPNISTFVGFGREQGAATELSIVQTAMDSMMAKNGLATVTPPAAETDNMSAFPNTTFPLYPNYLRFEKTNGTYDCDDSGLVEQTDSGYPAP